MTSSLTDQPLRWTVQKPPRKKQRGDRRGQKRRYRVKQRALRADTRPSVWFASGRRCSTCKALKPRDAFYADRSKAGGLATRCKACESVRGKRKYQLRKAAA